MARKFGFNFNEHKNDKIGMLRAFNRMYKPYCKKGKPGRKPKRQPVACLWAMAPFCFYFFY